eukprot:m.68077 g.68077  ORF g.68077 m.68077 type:complete len:151 (-) comp19862_c0_seq3:23-475(-)
MGKLSDILGDKVLADAKTTFNVANLELTCSVLGIFFSAGWCPTCKPFLPQLLDTYNKLLGADAKISFEIVFVSSDANEYDFADYYAQMPWLALPFSESETRRKLIETFKVTGLPTLVLLWPDGEIITTEGGILDLFLICVCVLWVYGCVV